MGIATAVLWDQREPVLELREPSWILKSAWTVPIALSIPLVWDRFSSPMLIAWAFFSASFLLYALIAYSIWGNWPNKGEKKRRIAILVIMGYDGLSLMLYSLAMLLSVILGLEFTGIATVSQLQVATLVLYVGLGIFVLVNGNSIVNFLIVKQEKGIPPAGKAALAIPAALVGAGVGLGVILKSSSIGLILAVGIMALAGYLLLPFALISFFQIAILAPTLTA